MIFPLGLLCTTLFCALLLVTEHRKSPVGKWLTKPVASTGFIIAALGAGAPRSAYGKAVLVALVLCWLGDMLLIPRKQATFLAGLGSFLAGHAVFVVAFLVRGINSAVAGTSLVVSALLAYFVTQPIVQGAEGRMRAPVVVYIAVVTLMAAVGVGAASYDGNWAIGLGAIAFWLSDVSVGRDRFVKRDFFTKLWGLPLYYGAQLLLAWSVSTPK